MESNGIPELPDDKKVQDGEWATLIDTIQDETAIEAPDFSQVVHESSSVHTPLEFMGGIDGLIANLKEFTQAFSHPESFESPTLPKQRAMLFVGPSGSGKTSLAYALGQELQAEVVKINPSDILHENTGDSARRLRKAFDLVQNEAQVNNCRKILLIEQLEALMGNGINAGTAKPLNTELDNILDNLAETHPNLLFIGTSLTTTYFEANSTIINNNARLRRFKIPGSDERVRLGIFSSLLSQNSNEFLWGDVSQGGINIGELVKFSSGMTAGDIVMILGTVQRSRNQGKDSETAIPKPVTQIDLLMAFSAFRSSR